MLRECDDVYWLNDPYIYESIESGASINITNSKLIILNMSLQELIDLVKFAFINGEAENSFVNKAPAAFVATLTSAISIVFNIHEHHPVDEVGIRHGEKMYKTLLSSGQKTLARD